MSEDRRTPPIRPHYWNDKVSRQSYSRRRFSWREPDIGANMSSRRTRVPIAALMSLSLLAGVAAAETSGAAAPDRTAVETLPPDEPSVAATGPAGTTSPAVSGGAPSDTRGGVAGAAGRAVVRRRHRVRGGLLLVGGSRATRHRRRPHHPAVGGGDPSGRVPTSRRPPGFTSLAGPASRHRPVGSPAPSSSTLETAARSS